LRELAPGTPPEMIEVIERAMARAIEDRYRDLDALRHELQAILEGRLTVTGRKELRNALIVGSSLMVICLAGGVATIQSGREAALLASGTLLGGAVAAMILRPRRMRYVLGGLLVVYVALGSVAMAWSGRWSKFWIVFLVAGLAVRLLTPSSGRIIAALVPGRSR
jgi:hypothetical protein